MADIKTSDTHPIRVDFVEREKFNLPGKIGLTFAPGKKHRGMTGHWDRDLDVDLARLREVYKVTLLVSLIEEHEFESLQIRELRKRAGDFGIRVLWSPIRDVSVPKSVEDFAPVIQLVIEALQDGQTVVIHCMGGLGRTGLAAACVLVVTTELTPKEAISIVRLARPGAVQTRGQEEFVELFQRFIKGLGKS